MEMVDIEQVVMAAEDVDRVDSVEMISMVLQVVIVFNATSILLDESSGIMLRKERVNFHATRERMETTKKLNEAVIGIQHHGDTGTVVIDLMGGVVGAVCVDIK